LASDKKGLEQLIKEGKVGNSPVKEFKKVFLQPGESKTISFLLSRNDLSFYKKT